MRQAYAHDAVPAFDAGADERGPGTAVTVALCGHWEHPPPCPPAAHHTAAERDGETLRLRVLFACEPADEAEVRRRITAALARWPGSGGPSPVRPDEADHAARLTAS